MSSTYPRESIGSFSLTAPCRRRYSNALDMSTSLGAIDGVGAVVDVKFAAVRGEWGSSGNGAGEGEKRGGF